MSYLTSGFITPSRPISFKSKNSKGPFYGKSALSIKSTKELCLSNLKHFKQESLQEPSRANKTPPLVLFINLLMKHGKKTHALRVLSMTLSLFKARISKIKLQKGVTFLKNSESFYQYFYNQGKKPLQGHPLGVPFSKNTLANYSIKATNLFVVFSKKSDKNKNGSRMPLNVVFPWYLNYRKPFPFIYSFSRVFDAFYTKKSFFCGKFLNLKQYSLMKKKPHQSAFFLFGFIKKRKNIVLKKSKEARCVHSKSEPLDYFAKKKTTAMSCHPMPLVTSTGHVPSGQVVAPKEHGRQGKQRLVAAPQGHASKGNLAFFRNKEGEDSKNCLWYKTLAKKPSWEKLTSAQKNTFLFCLYKAISNVKPPLECRTKRIGGSNKQIPSQVSEHRQWGIAIRWIIEVAQNEFSKKKNKITPYKPTNRSVLNNISKTSGHVQDRLKFPRGYALLSQGNALLTKNTVQSKQIQLGSWALDEKTKFLNSLLQTKAKAGSLKVHSQKTRFYCFCFFLAESLENAYYKTGPAMQRRNLWVETALANRAFLRYRWW